MCCANFGPAMQGMLIAVLRGKHAWPHRSSIDAVGSLNSTNLALAKLLTRRNVDMSVQQSVRFQQPVRSRLSRTLLAALLLFTLHLAPLAPSAFAGKGVGSFAASLCNGQGGGGEC